MAILANDKIYEDFEIQLELPELSREDMRKELFSRFLVEKGGHRVGTLTHATKYKYFVETLADGRRIFLKRPAHLNKGIDVEVWVERFDGIKDKRPSHGVIRDDLMAKKSENPAEYAALIEAISQVYSCKSPAEILAKRPLCFNTGLSPELILKVVKWLFIEQDLTYWNWEGRNMFMRGLLEI